MQKGLTMSHAEQIEYCKKIKRKFPEWFKNKVVVDIGSLDINGNNRYLFDNCIYVGVDVGQGNNVDIVSKGHELNFPDDSIDVIISTECFEHDMYYKKTLNNIYRMLKPGGFFLFTCATTGRAEHGTKRTTPEDAILLQDIDNWSDYYKNLTEKNIREVFDLEKQFSSHKFEVNEQNHDLNFYGFKAGTYSNSNSNIKKINNVLEQICLAKQTQIEFINKSTTLIRSELESLSPQKCVQLYLDQGNSFNEKDSIIKSVTKLDKVQVFEFDTSKFNNIKSLRIDPHCNAVVCSIDKITLQTSNDKIDLPISEAKSNAILNYNNTYFFSSSDPSIEFTLPRLKQVKISSITVKISYSHFNKDALSACANQLSIERENILSQNNQLKSHASQLTDQNNQLTTNVSQLTSNVSQLTDQNNQLTTNVSQLTDQNNQLTTNVSQLTSNVSQLTNQNNHLTTNVSQLTDQNNQLTTNVSQLTDQNNQLTTNVSQLTSNVSQLTNQNNHLTTNVSQLTDQNNQLTTNVSQLTDKNNQLTTNVSQLTDQNQELTSNVSQLTDQNQELTSNVSQLTDQNSQLTDLVSQLTEQNNKLTTNVSKLTDQNNELTSNVSQLTNQNNHLTTNVSQLTDNLNTIYSSKGWRLLTLYYRISGKLIPLGSIRRKLLAIPYKTAKRPLRLIWKAAKFINPLTKQAKEEYRIIKKSRLFDSKYYRKTYSNLGIHKLFPLRHFVKYGWKEGRNPNSSFDTLFYLATYPEPLNLGMNPLFHYINNKNSESLARNQQELEYITILESNLFDENYYLALYPDVKEARCDPLMHYITNGWKEGRKPSKDFNTLSYSNAYSAETNPLFHYAISRQLENKKTSKIILNNKKLQVIKNEFVLSSKIKKQIPKINFDLKTKNQFVKYQVNKKIKPDLKIIAFFLPQFHPFPENDMWWEKGFTEWTNVTKAKPQFKGHYQPHFPIHNGFYDLRVPEVMIEQAKLAKNYGIYGFNFYYYWFAGKVLMHKPLNSFLKNKAIDINFCITWANENWTRTWDGGDNDILIEQKHSANDSINFLKSLYKYFKDKRYIKINNKPILIIYRANIIPHIKETANLWRKQIIEDGFEGIYLICAQTFGISSPFQYGFDAAMEFPPHTVVSREINNEIVGDNSSFLGRIYDYGEAVNRTLNKIEKKYKVFRTAMLSWDKHCKKAKQSQYFSWF